MSQVGKAQSIAIVGGCGHVGLPLGIVLADRGANVTLIDTSQDRVQAVLAGSMPFIEHGSEQIFPRVLASGRLRATTDVHAVREHDAVFVTIGTPVDEFLDPSIRVFDEAVMAVVERMNDGQLLILRSTVFPGVTERLARRIEECGRKIEVAYCPERIAQAYAFQELPRLPQIIGGATPAAARRAEAIFQILGVTILHVSPTEAELAKLFANAYRYINFAISNQFYCIAERFGANFQRVHEAATHDYPRLAGLVKAGLAAGPCLLKDTMQLSAFNHNGFALGQAAMMVNEGLPHVLVESAKAKYGLRNKTAAILGMAFKGNCVDIRDSLSFKLRKLLTLECRTVLCTDPFIADPSFVPLETALAQADIVFLGACHKEYKAITLQQPAIDVFGFWSK